MNRFLKAALVSVLLLIFSLSLSWGTTYAHEKAHEQTYIQLGYYNNTIHTTPFGGHMQNHDQVLPEHKERLYIANRINDAILYNLNGYLTAICIVLFGMFLILADSRGK